MNSNSNKFLLVLACGEGRRNAAFTFEGAIPKCLQTAGDKTILEAILAKYDDLVDTKYIACLTKHEQQINDILNFKGVKNFKTIAIDQTPSAFLSLATVVKKLGYDTLSEGQWYLNWSDVFATMPAKHPAQNTIFVDDTYQHRNLSYIDTDNKVQVVSTGNLSGNVPGIFYVDGKLLYDLCIANITKGTLAIYDFDKLLATTEHCQLHVLSDVTDIGDYVKFTKYMTDYVNDHQSRYFNNITIRAKTILKSPVDDYGMKLHKIELSYYKNIADRIPAFAQLQSYNRESSTMELERIKGTTCQAKLDACTTKAQLQNKADKLLETFETAIAQVHELKSGNVPTPEQLTEAIYKEFLYAMTTRVEPVKSLIDSVIASGVTSIDGMPITKSYETLYNAVKQWLDTKVAEHYFKGAITHGDPNTDNCMVQNDGSIRFIDPRGYFGGLSVLGYGIKQYDYAKFVYGMTGYSRFNRASFVACSIENGNVSTFIGMNELAGIADVDIYKLNVDDDIKVLVGIIWVKLSSYIINDPERSVLAYLYGNAMLTKLLNIK